MSCCFVVAEVDQLIEFCGLMETAFFHLETNLSVYFCYLNEDCDTLSFSFVKWSTFLLVIFFFKENCRDERETRGDVWRTE